MPSRLFSPFNGADGSFPPSSHTHTEQLLCLVRTQPRSAHSTEQAQVQAAQQTMHITAEHAGGAVVLELDEGCRSVAALRRIISAALRHLKEDGFDVTVQGRAVEDVDVCGLEEGATIQVVESRRVVALAALRAAGRDVSEDGLKDGIVNAAESGDVALCEQYLDAGVSPDLTWSRNRFLSVAPLICHTVRCTDQSALHSEPPLAVCELLLSRGCDANTPTGRGTVLHMAASCARPKFCKLLLQHGADVNRREADGSQPLHSGFSPLSSRHRIYHEVREVLLQHGADMRAKNSAGDSPLDVARKIRRNVVEPRRFSAYDQFVKYGAPPMTRRERKHSRYIQKVTKVQFKKRKQQITREGKRIVNALLTDVLERLGGEGGRVTLSVRSVVAAVKLQLPEELATHALAVGTAAVRRYAKACGGRR